ncbi:MAG: hypothetical protein Q8K82_16200 [Gemmatimonadaceae bacterium]|nr:hypothetical protein [Gemmatimonadaceae bacterium]
MKHGTRAAWVVRVSWPVLGGVWGAWVGFRGYLRLPDNADSFGTMLAAGFFGLFALGDLAIGVAVGALIGRSVEKLLRRSGVGVIAAMAVATLVNALILWQLAEWVQARFPGMRP